MKTLKQAIDETFISIKLANEDFFDNANVGVIPAKEEIKKQVEHLYVTKNVIVNDDLTIDADEIIISTRMSFKIEADHEIKFKFNKVKLFEVEGLKIKDFTNFPKYCVSLRIIKCPNISSLKDMPEIIDEIYNAKYYTRGPELEIKDCSKIKSLNGMQKNIPGRVNIANCGIQDLSGLSSKVNRLTIDRCNKLTTLKGAEQLNISGSLTIYGCIKLTTLKYVPKKLGSLYLYGFYGENLTGIEDCDIEISIAIERCMKLKTLTGLSPEFSGILYADFHKLKSIEYGGDKVEELFPKLKHESLYFHR